MNDPFLELEWQVFAPHEWTDLLDHRGKRIVVPAQGLVSLEGPSSVDLAWEQFELNGHGAGPVLRPAPLAESLHLYRPMRREDAALFRVFAELDYHDLDAIRSFADKYGLLGVPSKHYPVGESHLTWAREICLMKEAMTLAQPKTAATEAHERRSWNKHDEGVRAFRAAQGLSTTPQEDPAAVREWNDRNKLAWLFNRNLQNVQARIAFDRDVPPRLSYKPLTLIAAMWLKFGLAIQSDKQFRKCKFCGRWLEISTDPTTGFRTHREFCTHACKTKDYRRRKRTALRLAKTGARASAIADQIQTDKKTVRRWLGAVGTHQQEKR